MKTKQRERLVLVGNGMAGMNTIEYILKLSPGAYDITVRVQPGLSAFVAM